MSGSVGVARMDDCRSGVVKPDAVVSADQAEKAQANWLVCQTQRLTRVCQLCNQFADVGMMVLAAGGLDGSARRPGVHTHGCSARGPPALQQQDSVQALW